MPIQIYEEDGGQSVAVGVSTIKPNAIGRHTAANTTRP
jgi:hypothetical protein